MNAVKPADNGRMVLKNGIKAVHEAFADYMLINPGATLRELSGYFGYSVAWCCTVMNTDMFKAYLAERRKEINIQVAEDLPAKLVAAGHLATERIIEVIEKTDDPDLLVDAFDKVMHRLGYAPKATAPVGSPVNVQNNNVFFLSKDEHAAVREKLIQAHQPPPALPDKKENAEGGDGELVPAA